MTLYEAKKGRSLEVPVAEDLLMVNAAALEGHPS
jgi:hypothetical protein